MTTTVKNFSTTISAPQTPDQVFAAICDVPAWWGKITGETNRLGAEFTFEHEDVHRSTHRVTEFVPGKRIEWTTVDSRIAFVENKSEWTNTRITFDLAPNEGGTDLVFTHVGLSPKLECYDGCSGAWGFLINDSLYELLTTGKGQPF